MIRRSLDALLLLAPIAAALCGAGDQRRVDRPPASPEVEKPLTVYNAIVDRPEPDLGDVPTPGWHRCEVFYGASTDPRWPRIHPRTGERIAGGMPHLMTRRQRADYLEAVRAWAAALPGDVPAVMVNVDESVTLPIERSRKHIVSQISAGGEVAAEFAWASLARQVIAVIREARPDAKIGWFLQARWTDTDTVAAMAPVFGELDWIGVTLYLTRDPRTPWWRQHLASRLRRVAEAAPAGTQVWAVVQGQYHGAALGGLSQTEVPVDVAALLLTISRDQGAGGVVVWGQQTVDDHAQFRAAVHGVMNLHEAAGDQ